MDSAVCRPCPTESYSQHLCQKAVALFTQYYSEREAPFYVKEPSTTLRLNICLTLPSKCLLSVFTARIRAHLVPHMQNQNDKLCTLSSIVLSKWYEINDDLSKRKSWCRFEVRNLLHVFKMSHDFKTHEWLTRGESTTVSWKSGAFFNKFSWLYEARLSVKASLTAVKVPFLNTSVALK